MLVDDPSSLVRVAVGVVLERPGILSFVVICDSDGNRGVSLVQVSIVYVEVEIAVSGGLVGSAGVAPFLGRTHVPQWDTLAARNVIILVEVEAVVAPHGEPAILCLPKGNPHVRSVINRPAQVGICKLEVIPPTRIADNIRGKYQVIGMQVQCREQTPISPRYAWGEVIVPFPPNGNLVAPGDEGIVLTAFVVAFARIVYDQRVGVGAKAVMLQPNAMFCRIIGKLFSLRDILENWGKLQEQRLSGKRLQVQVSDAVDSLHPKVGSESGLGHLVGEFGLCRRGFAIKTNPCLDPCHARVIPQMLAHSFQEAPILVQVVLIPVFGQVPVIGKDQLGIGVSLVYPARGDITATAEPSVCVYPDGDRLPFAGFCLYPGIQEAPIEDARLRFQFLPGGVHVPADYRVGVWIQVVVVLEHVNPRLRSIRKAIYPRREFRPTFCNRHMISPDRHQCNNRKKQ